MGLLDILDGPTQLLGSLTGNEDMANRLGDPLDFLGIQGAAAADDAAAIQAASYQKGLELLKRQFRKSQKNIRPFMQAGEGVLPFLEQGASVQGLDEILREIMNTDSFGSLVADRTESVESMLGAGGLMRSGEAIEQGAAIPTDLALQISQMITGNAGNVATMGANAAVGAGSQGAQFGNTGAQLQGLTGNALGSGILGGQQAQAQGAQGLATILASFFGSDPRLKTNAREIGKLGPLTMYEWDWRPEFKGTIVEEGPRIGFMSTDVKEHYPQFVGEFGGFDTVNYSGLIDELERAV